MNGHELLKRLQGLHPEEICLQVLLLVDGKQVPVTKVFVAGDQGGEPEGLVIKG